MTGKTYTTIQGDMWDSIAFKTLGSTAHTAKLMWANRAHLDIYEFPAGIVLEIPEIAASVSDNLPPWKRGGS